MQLHGYYKDTLEDAEPEYYDRMTKYFFVFKEDNILGLKLLQLEIGGEGEEGMITPPILTFFLLNEITEES